MTKPFYSQDDVARARELDLLTYLENYEPYELVRVSGNVYSTRTHDSLKISNGMWMWWSQGIGGRNALDYLIKVQGLSLYEAVDRILGKNFSIPNISKPPPEMKPKVLELPERADNNDRAIEYLSRRGISKTVIDYCTENGLIYQSKAYENVVFVGYDRDNTARYAAVRSTDKSGFKGDVSGSDKTFSFRFDKGDGDTLHVFEGAIDLLSYATLAEENLLCDNDIDTPEQLTAYKEKCKDEITELTEARNKLRSMLKTAQRHGNEKEITELKDDISILSERLKRLRRDILVCERIEEQEPKIEEKIDKAKESNMKEMTKDERFRRRR